MGWLFGRKKKEIIPEEKECNHKWKDFPWYLETAYYTGSKSYNMIIYEPYVCIHCKQRKNIILNKVYRTNETWEDCLKEEKIIEERYKDHLKPKCIVEDMIHDFQLIDRAYLDAFEKWQAMR